MSLIPEFELGLWNAWILVLSLFLSVLVLTPLIARVFFTGNEKPAESSRSHNPSGLFNIQEKRLYKIAMVITFASYFYSIFLPLRLGPPWFYAGLVVYLVGVLFGIMAQIGFATPPLDEPATKGVYRSSRNPMYFGTFLIYIGISIACLSWIFLLIAVVGMILDNNVFVIAEERWCLEKYGDAYREYMNKTPKWIGIPKSKKRD
jgi:protein-S-isoprenylcysteine O-methyltransferase Ste14